ncbi:MAG: hypothetical protein IJ439_07695 [Tyzzerella sp.]|nr:hypothetical protein [Tyzzerella sp.]
MKSESKNFEKENFERKNLDKENERIIDSYDYLANAASTQDCTGLIPAIPDSDEELESYKDIYHFEPPKVKLK